VGFLAESQKNCIISAPQVTYQTSSRTGFCSGAAPDTTSVRFLDTTGILNVSAEISCLTVPYWEHIKTRREIFLAHPSDSTTVCEVIGECNGERLVWCQGYEQKYSARDSYIEGVCNNGRLCLCWITIEEDSTRQCLIQNNPFDTRKILCQGFRPVNSERVIDLLWESPFNSMRLCEVKPYSVQLVSVTDDREMVLDFTTDFTMKDWTSVTSSSEFQFQFFNLDRIARNSPLLFFDEKTTSVTSKIILFPTTSPTTEKLWCFFTSDAVWLWVDDEVIEVEVANKKLSNEKFLLKAVQNVGYPIKIIIKTLVNKISYIHWRLLDGREGVILVKIFCRI